MAARTRLLLVLAAVLLLSAGGSEAWARPAAGEDSTGGEVPTAGAVSSAQGVTTRWDFLRVDRTQDYDRGYYASLAIDPISDRPYISYYDATRRALRLARYVGTGGNCGYEDGDWRWHCGYVGALAADDRGRYSSLAITRNKVMGGMKLGIAHFDNSAYQPRWFVETCPPVGECSSSEEEIDTGSSLISGKYASLAFDSGSSPHITFQMHDRWNVEASLGYAHYVGTGGNCGSDLNWQCDAIETGYQYARATSVGLDAADYPHIAYLDNGNRLKYARRLDYAGGNCGPGGDTWGCWVIDPEGFAGPVSLYVPREGSGQPSIAYVQNDKLKYAELVGSGGNCGAWLGVNSWRCTEIDDVGDMADGVSLAFDAAGQPLIAYQDLTNNYGYGILKVAHPVQLPSSEGNCGPMAGPWHTWRCDEVYPGVSMGQYASIGLTASGLAYVASYDPTEHSLAVAYQRAYTFLPLLRR